MPTQPTNHHGRTPSSTGYSKAIPAASTGPSMSVSLVAGSLAPNFPFNFPEIKFEQSMSSPEKDDDAPTLRILETSIKELIPWDVTFNALQPLVNELWQSDQAFGANGTTTQLEPLLDVLFQNGLLKVRAQVGQLNYIPLTVDIWNLDDQRFATVWASLDNRTQVLKTVDISLIDLFDKLKEEIDKVRIQFCTPLQSHVYVFDNDYQRLVNSSNDDIYYFCPLHELEATLSEALLESDEEFPVSKSIRKVQQYCSQHPSLFISGLVSSHKPSSSWRQKLTLLKIIVENKDEIRDVLSANQDIAIVLNKEIWTFLSPFLEAFLAFTPNLSLTVATLWRVKLEDHYKPRDSDSSILAALKERFKKPFEKRTLHPMGLIAVCLDPRFKRLKMLSQTLREATYAKIRQLVSNLQADQRSENDSTEGLSSKRQKTSDLVSFNEYMDDSNEAEKDELDKYLDLDLGQPSDSESREFWTGEYSSRYAGLAHIARQLLLTPTVPHSCQYLTEGRSLGIRRQALVGDHLDEILFLHSLFR